MNVISALALVLLTLVGYAAGAVLAGHRRKVAPVLADLALVVALWVLALVSRPFLGKWLAIAVWMAAGMALGAVAVRLRLSSCPADKAGAAPAVANRWRAVWAAWTAFAGRLGNYQSRLWLGLFYFVLVLPFGVLMRLFDNRLRARGGSGGSVWSTKEAIDTDIESARSQF